MKVCQAINDRRFQMTTHVIEYISNPEDYGKTKDAYYIRQVTYGKEEKDGGLIMVERHRGFKTKVTDPYPEWRFIRGSGGGKSGFYGIWLPHYDDLMSECTLVAKTENVNCTHCNNTGKIPVPKSEGNRFGKATHLVCAYCGGSSVKT